MRMKQLVALLASLVVTAVMVDASGEDRTRSRDGSCGKECVCPCDPVCTGAQKQECKQGAKGNASQDRRKARDGSCTK